MIDLSARTILRQYALVITINFALFQMGLSVAWLSPVLVKLTDEHQDILPKPLGAGDEAAWFISVSNIVAMTGILFTSFIMNNLGRKTSLILSSVPRLVMCGFVLFASRPWMLIAGRCVCGLSDFMGVAVVAPYASEIASKELRGGLGTIMQILSAIGGMIMLITGPFVSYLNLNIIFTCLMIGTFLPMLVLPESPYFLFTKGKTDEAMKLLIKLRGNEALAREEIKEYTASNPTKLDKKTMFKDPVTLKTIVKVIFLAISSQLTGYNAVMFYLQTIFESTHTTIRSEISSAVIGCIQLLACICTVFVADRFGRKPVLTISLFWMAVGMAGLGTFFKLKETMQISGFLNYLPLISMIIVIYCYNAGMASLLWTVVAELFDGPSRAVGVTIAVFAATVFTFLTTRYFPAVTANFGPAYTYWFFSGYCLLTSLFIIIFVPETKGKTFSQIQTEMGRDVGGEKEGDAQVKGRNV